MAKKNAITRSKKKRELKNPDTGDVVVIKAYEKYPEEFRYISKMMYITGRAGVSEISRQLNIPKNTLTTWQRRDKWVLLRRKVQRLANRDAVKVARKSMSVYIKEVDRGLNTMMSTLNTRLDNVEDDQKIKSEAAIYKNLLDIWRLKIMLIRTLTYGVQGKAFTPHPTTMMFDGTEEQATKSPTKLFTASAVDDIMQVIPEYMQEAAKLILGVGPEDWDEDVLDAVTNYLDEGDDIDDVDLDDDEATVVTNMLMEDEEE